MKKKSLRIIILLLIITSCNNKQQSINGYFVGPEPKFSGKNEIGINRNYYRISGDTVVEFSTNFNFFIEGEKNYTDSVRLVWNGRYYEDVYNEIKSPLPFKINDSTEIDASQVKFGNHKYKILKDGKLKFSLDTTKNFSEAHMAGNEDIEYFLKPVNKIYIKNSIEKDRTKDSVIFNTPDIPAGVVKEAVQKFFTYSYDTDYQGQIIDNSVEIKKDAGEFILYFSSKRPYSSTIINHRYLFDFTLLDYEVKEL